MSALTERLASIEGRAALIGYLPVGYPSVEGSIQAMVAMIEAGVDVIEVGIPYSDPVLDGPVIQQAAEAALAGRTRRGFLERCCDSNIVVCATHFPEPSFGRIVQRGDAFDFEYSTPHH